MRSKRCIVLLDELLLHSIKLRMNDTLPFFLSVALGLGKTRGAMFLCESDGWLIYLSLGLVHIWVGFFGVGSEVGVVVGLDVWNGGIA